MNDRKKTVLLLILIFSVFGLVGWRVASVPGQVTPPPPGNETTLDSNGQPVAAGSNAIQLAVGSSAGKASGTAAKPISVIAPAVVSGPDPFRTAVSNTPISPIRPEIAALPKSRPHPTQTIRGSDLDQPLTPLRGDILPSPSGGSVEVRADPAPILKVSGVLAGDKPVAILKLGDQQFVVGVGATFGDGYVLKSVSSTQVVVTQGKKSFFLPTIGA